MYFAVRRFLLISAASFVLVVPAVRAQSTRSWTGLAAPNNNWTTVGNWNTGVPVSGDTALFNGNGNGNTSISLGGATQPINTVRFDGAIATPYTVGVLNSGDKLNFDNGGSIVVANNITVLQTINAAIQTNGGLTVTNSGALGLTLAGAINIGNFGPLNVNTAVNGTTTTLGGNITDSPGQPGTVILSFNDAASVIINGSNTYLGPTTINANASGAGIQLGSNSPFGTGTVSVNLVGGMTAPRFHALTSPRDIPNAMNLNSGLTFGAGPNLSFTGPLTIINSLAGGTRTFSNLSGFSTATFGASPGSSTITLGNPVANGGDGVGKTLILSPSIATYVVNDVLQDPAPGGGAASGSVQYAGSGGTIQINSLSTYTGQTLLNGGSTIQFNNSYNTGDPSGPFGLGTLVPNNATNNTLQPVGGSRTVANPLTMNFGLSVANASADTSSLTLTGPITMTANGRTITNNFGVSGGTLTLGSAASPSTLTLPTSGGQVLTIGGTGATVINDVIQNPASVPSPAPGLAITASGSLRFNGLSTFTGDTTFTGSATTVRIGVSSNGAPGPSFTAGPFGTGTLVMNASSPPSLQPIGADRSISNPITMTFGFVVSNPTPSEDPTGAHNLDLNGPITLGATSRIITNNMSPGAILTLGSQASPSTISLSSTLTFLTQNLASTTTIVNDAITGAGAITVQDRAFVQINGAASYSGVTLVTGTGSELRVNGTKSGSGAVTVGVGTVLSGSGSVAGAITNNGTIDPSAETPQRTLTAVSSVTMGASSHLKIDLSGSLADKLAVGGALNLAAVDFLDVAGGAGTGSWVIASYGSLTGTFNTVTTGYSVNYGTGTNSQITLTRLPTGINGDFNNDGQVDAGDFVTWRKNNGTSNGLPNDNGLGTPVGASHYTLWRANFGKPPGSALDGSAAVPEPASLLLAFLAIASAKAASARRRPLR
jgi:hypothetical protein